MTRIAFAAPENMTKEQLRVRDIALSSARGVVAGPLHAWLLSPDVAEHAHKLGAFLGYLSSVPRRIVELSIIVTAMERDCDFAWQAHLPRAIEFGVSLEITRALKSGNIPEFDNEDEYTAYEIVTALCRQNQLSDALFASGVEKFGEQGVVEITALVGFYTMVAMTLNVFGVPDD